MEHIHAYPIEHLLLILTRYPSCSFDKLTKILSNPVMCVYVYISLSICTYIYIYIYVERYILFMYSFVVCCCLCCLQPPPTATVISIC